MKIAKIYKITIVAPFCDQESWDNSGLLVGDMNDRFELVYASLDVDSKLLDSLENGSHNHSSSFNSKGLKD